MVALSYSHAHIQTHIHAYIGCCAFTWYDSTIVLGKQQAIFCSNKNKNKNTVQQGNAKEVKEVKEVVQKVKQSQCNLQEKQAQNAPGTTTTNIMLN